MKTQCETERLDGEFQKKLDENVRLAEEKTNKKREKRKKKKANSRNKGKKPKLDEVEEKEESESEELSNEEVDNENEATTSADREENAEIVEKDPVDIVVAESVSKQDENQ